MAPCLLLPTRRPGLLGHDALASPTQQASAPGLEPPPSSAPKSTVSLFWVTTRHAQGISTSACGVSDSPRPLMHLTPSGSKASYSLPLALAWDP